MESTKKILLQAVLTAAIVLAGIFLKAKLFPDTPVESSTGESCVIIDNLSDDIIDKSSDVISDEISELADATGE